MEHAHNFVGAAARRGEAVEAEVATTTGARDKAQPRHAALPLLGGPQRSRRVPYSRDLTTRLRRTQYHRSSTRTGRDLHTTTLLC